MTNQFIVFGEKRIRLSSVKKYEPMQSVQKDAGIKVFYSLSSKPQYDVFYFDSNTDRDEAIRRLDDAFGVA